LKAKPNGIKRENRQFYNNSWILSFFTFYNGQNKQNTKEMKVSNYITNGLDLKDLLQNILTKASIIFLRCTWDVLMGFETYGTDHMLEHKTSLNKFTSLQSLLEINNRRKLENSQI
jgi:hypothetical protein